MIPVRIGVVNMDFRVPISDSIPDAPYIREAEMYGIPSPDPVFCPVCGAECEDFYIQEGDVIGCECCIRVRDAYDWMIEHTND